MDAPLTVEQLRTIRAGAQALLTLTDQMLQQDLPTITNNLAQATAVNKEWKQVMDGKK